MNIMIQSRCLFRVLSEWAETEGFLSVDSAFLRIAYMLRMMFTTAMTSEMSMAPSWLTSAEKRL